MINQLIMIGDSLMQMKKLKKRGIELPPEDTQRYVFYCLYRCVLGIYWFILLIFKLQEK